MLRPALRRLVLAVLMALAAVPSLAASPREEVVAATARWIDAFNRKSATDIVALYAPEATFFGTGSSALRSTPEAVAEYFANLGALGNAVITMGHYQVQLLGNTAIHSGFYTRSSVANGQMSQAPARFTFVYGKRGGRWVILHHHSSAFPAN
jgi:uncharacterized protein (TIGR02246 family)